MLLAFPLAAGCGDGDDGGGAASSGASTSSATTGGGTAECDPDVDAPEEVLPGAGDPEAGSFTLDEALADLPEGPGPLRAILDTDKGVITCELFPEQAPNAVANFVGLARGRRPWQDPATGSWVKRRFYDGLTFHRVIPEFMVQGGDPLANGEGWPGYELDDELSALKHRAGTLAYANAGADTNGSQFYITEVATDWLDGSYTIFGQCAPVEVVTAMTHVATDAGDKPLAELRLRKVTIARCAP